MNYINKDFCKILRNTPLNPLSRGEKEFLVPPLERGLRGVFLLSFKELISSFPLSVEASLLWIPLNDFHYTLLIKG
jgi:hypothetical protein